MHLLTWKDAYAAGVESAGGKGWNLSRLHRYGFLVPPGVVVSAAAYRHFLGHPDLHDLLSPIRQITTAEEAAQPDVVPRLERLRQAIEQAPLPAQVAGELHAFLSEQGLLDRAVAVRSSASAEDSARASFAGIHQSFLNISGLPAITASLKGCWASLWTPQALVYRRKMGLSDEEVAAAVVILAMVEARSAGIAFSCDPRTGRRDRYAISASLGLGEAIVGGQVEPDEYLIDITQYPPGPEERRIAPKRQMTAPSHNGGTELVAVPPEKRTKPALTDQQITELTMLVGRIHDSLGEMEHPQDVEWAHDGRQFWVLQARPVTTLPPPTFPAVADQPIYWSNANLKEVLPGVQSTLGWSFMRSGIDTLLNAPLEAAGYPHTKGMRWIRLFHGRAYFNLTALQWAFYDAIGIDPHEFNQIIGGHQPEITISRPGLGDRMRRRLASLRVIRSAMRVMARSKTEFDRLWRWAENAEQADMTGMSAEALLALSLKVKDEMDGFLPQFNLINGTAGSTHQEVIKILAPLFGDRAPSLANAMLAGSTGITSAEQGERLITLSNKALREEAVRGYFADPSWDPGDWQEKLAGTLWAEEFAQYLREYGHRGVYELEPANQRWRENPSYLLETVRAQVQAGRETRLADQRPKREAALREVMQKVGLGVRRIRLQLYLTQAARSAALREMAKSIVVKVAGISRLVALEVGRRLVERGLLAERDQVFSLSWTDMEAFLKGRNGIEGFPCLVADRLARRQEHLQQEAPDVFVGEVGLKRAPLPEVTGTVLLGIGVATGRSSGLARLIHHPDEGSRLMAGEILVAPSTDPAWTPLFLRAAGIVMEVGGYLSHGAIVAREYGLPAVVNIPGLLRTVKDGETLVVDGDAGKVYREG